MTQRPQQPSTGYNDTAQRIAGAIRTSAKAWCCRITLAAAAATAGCTTHLIVSPERSTSTGVIAGVDANNAGGAALAPPIVGTPAFVAARDVVALYSPTLTQTALPEPPRDLWARMRRGFQLPPLEHALVKTHTQRFHVTRYFFGRAERIRLFLPLIVGEIEKRGLPMELALVPLVESALNCQARSVVAAAGCWQFMSYTAKDQQLTISALVDQRRDLIKSTDAALGYLRTLQAQIGDWHLALAGYNWGVGRVRRLRDRARSQGLGHDFASLAKGMPAETRNYVPQMEALKRLIVEGALDDLPDVPDLPMVQTVHLQHDIDVALVAKLAGIAESELLKLNHALQRPVILAAAVPDLLLPIDTAERFNSGLLAHRGPLSSWKVVRTQGHASVHQLAEQQGMSVTALREANGIPVGMKPMPGSTLLVSTSGQVPQRIDDAVVASAQRQLVPEVVRLWVRSRRKDTLGTLAARIGVPMVNLVHWNPTLPNSRVLKSGTRVAVLVAPELQTQVQRAAAAIAAHSGAMHRAIVKPRTTASTRVKGHHPKPSRPKPGQRIARL